MKKIPIAPMTDEKMEAYINGSLKLYKKRSTGQRFFIVGKRRGNVCKDQRRAYYRTWYFKNNVKDMPEVTKFLDAFHKKRFPDSYRGAQKTTPKVRLAIQDVPRATAKAPRKRRINRKALLAYRHGYNSAYRSQGIKIATLERRLAGTDKGFFGSVADLFSKLSFS